MKQSDAYQRPSGVLYVLVSDVAPLCKSRYPIHFVAVDLKSTRIVVDQLLGA